MFPPEAFQPLLESMAALFGARGIRFALTGGLVSAFYSEPRYTQDADIVVDRDDMLASLDAILDDFREAGYLFDAGVVRDAIQHRRQFQLFHTVELLKLDMYPEELVPGELERSVLAEVFTGVRLPIICQTDLIASKLVWISMGSHKSRRDVRQMMRRVGAAGEEEVRRLATDLGLLSLLDEVLAEPDELTR